uniref:Uncharacterized protein n=1 Tax=Arion vulgaris TaxID=1028688 RepID=A0A0B6ZQF0_9EUPU
MYAQVYVRYNKVTHEKLREEIKQTPVTRKFKKRRMIDRTNIKKTRMYMTNIKKTSKMGPVLESEQRYKQRNRKT